MKIIDVMLDLETYGKGPKAAIMQVAAVPFIRCDPHFQGTSFSEFISKAANFSAGLEADEDTITWWESQDPATYDRVFRQGQGSTKTVAGVLERFATYLETLKTDSEADVMCIWGNGSVFDNRILATAYQVCGLPVPWKYNADRDMRTVIDIGSSLGLQAKDIPFTGVRHDALHDCNHQIKQVQLVFEHLKEIGKK